MTTHLSEGLVRDVHGERHGVATVPPRAFGPGFPTQQQSTQLICVLNLHTTVVVGFRVTSHGGGIQSL